jgi:hypothetical protein
MEGPKSEKTKDPPKRVNHKMNIKFPNPFFVARSISNKERGRRPKRMFDLEEPLLIAITCFKIEITYTYYNATNTLCI